MKKGRWVYAVILLLLMALILLSRLYCGSGERKGVKTELAGKEKSPESVNTRGILNRNSSRIIYTKHAKCRMGCRRIDASEVEEILQRGTINYQKSDLRSSSDPKYALEGITHDGQRVRIIIANSPRGAVLITVIDLEKEWHCNCK
jgi:Domain of unknown function (DUF4258)